MAELLLIMIKKKENIKSNNLKVNNEKKIKKKNRCNCEGCNKKLSLVEQTMTCKCGLNFCSKHINQFNHNCIYDYKKNNKLNIEKNNPKITDKKIELI